MSSATATQRSGSPADQQPPHSAGGAAPRPFTLSSNLAASGPGRNSSVAAESGSSSMPKYRASIGVPGAGGAGQAGQGHGGGSASANWRAVSPGRASTGGVGLGATSGGGLRPASELLGVSQAGQALNSLQSSDSEFAFVLLARSARSFRLPAHNRRADELAVRARSRGH
ncbi:hypothetical protein AAT19DRAFT_11870 [Rhodotorula toruloides]|uniref:Uncharacterized protein n=1 Tax=Rhodotorula toruloides TaxID=5286 RepID=A0A2S9ZVR3_RHOTO|nr:hypothetical protein AAT19DRAFT_11870 [Rhodotorula toruloides]